MSPITSAAIACEFRRAASACRASRRQSAVRASTRVKIQYTNSQSLDRTSAYLARVCVCSVVACAAGPGLFAAPQGQGASGPWSQHLAGSWRSYWCQSQVLCRRSRGSRGTIDSHTHVRIESVSSVPGLAERRTRGLSPCVAACFCVCSVDACAAGPELFAAPQGQRVPAPWWRWRTHPTLIPPLAKPSSQWQSWDDHPRGVLDLNVGV